MASEDCVIEIPVVELQAEEIAIFEAAVVVQNHSEWLIGSKFIR